MSAHGGHQPTRKAHDLAEHLKQAIADYRMRDAKVSDQDVQMAVGLLRTATPGENRVAFAVLAAIVGVFVAVGIGISAAKGRVGGGPSAPAIYVGIALAITGTIVGVLVGRRSY